MRLSKFLSLLCFLTVVSLIYVQLQVEIFKQAYQGSLNQSELREVLDDNSVLMYNILSLKSAQNVGDSLLSKDKHLHFAQAQQINEVKGPLQVATVVQIDSSQSDKQQNLLSSIFALKSQAEAKQ